MAILSRDVTRYLRALLFYSLTWPWTFFLALLFLPSLVLPGSKPFVHWSAQFWARSMLWCLRVCCGLTHRATGLEHRPAQPCIYASKHQSAWDTLVFFTLVPRPVYVLKRELMRIPIIGWYLTKMGFIPINRSAGTEALRQMLRASERAIAQGSSIIIYPEGTRVPPGETGRYQPGAGAMAAHLQVPVVPVALNSGLFWKRNAVGKTPGEITLQFLPSLPAGLKSREVSTALEQAIEPACRALLSNNEKMEIR